MALLYAMRYARIVLCDAWVSIYASRIPMLKAIVGNDAFRNLLVSYERKIFGCNTLSVADMVRMERNDLCNFGKVCGLCLLSIVKCFRSHGWLGYI